MGFGRKKHFPLIGFGSGVAVSPLMNGLLGHWKLSDTSDALGVRTLTNVGSTPFAAGKIGNCADLLIASGQYLHRASETLGFTTAMSVAAWFKQDAAANDQTILQIGDNGLTPTSFLKLESNYVHQGGSSATTTTHSGLATSNLWRFRAVTISGTSMKIYENGDAPISVVLNQAFGADISRRFIIGGYSNGALTANFDGLIDAVSLASRQWSDSDVALLWNSGNGREHPYLP